MEEVRMTWCLLFDDFSAHSAHRWIVMLHSAPEFQMGVRKLGTTPKARCEAAAGMDNV
ncbi:hypothetical protein I79_020074 [Cricetulus griseus]|uniref:Uncharacterized protein n=1 Tax=Cricetulus griseus TaxID=10029 RepID=G3I941_CRIGR|nr:hypothetical protein I79_020074 [Cricetulus griseus]